MKAARVLRFGPPNVIINNDLPRPEPATGQLLLRVHIGSRNASATQPATLLVFFVKKIAAPPTVALRTTNAPH